MQQFTVKELAKNLLMAFRMANVDPSKDTIVSAVDKFQEMDVRYLVLYLENGGFLCLCADPEMSKRLHASIEAINDELDALADSNEPSIQQAG